MKAHTARTSRGGRVGIIFIWRTCTLYLPDQTRAISEIALPPKLFEQCAHKFLHIVLL